MEYHEKQITNEEDFLAVLPIIKKFPLIHNKLKADFVVLLEFCENNKEDKNKFEPLYCALIKGLFSLIEADIYYYNIFDSYEDYSDRQHFLIKFKKTFKQICNTWNREDLRKVYFATKLHDLILVKKIRDFLTHPKEIEHVTIATEEGFRMIKEAFADYDQFISTIMSNFYFTTVIPPDRLDYIMTQIEK